MAVPVTLYRAALKWADDDGRTAFNILHFDCPEEGDNAADVAGLLGAHGPGVVALASMSEHAAVREITVTNVTDDSDSAVYTGPWTGWTGGGGSPDYAPGLSAIYRIHTARAGRRGKGRIFLPFCSEAAVTKGRFIGDVLALSAAAFKAHALDTWMADDNLILGVHSETYDVFSPMTDMQLNPIPGFRRKRANSA